ncbi:MAG: HDIG domain-containing protein [Paludibacteraceae bacterium]|nr:HDIG domain-containing protein [Paludibacteraceae bacterium]
MKPKITQKRLQILTRVVLFLCAITIIVQIFPRQGSFKYQFQVGKPWTYELVTAPFNFPIYKDKKEFDQEQKDRLRSFEAYYRINNQVARKQLHALGDSLVKLQNLPQKYKQYIAAQIKHVYEVGLIKTEDLDTLSENGYTSVLLIDSQQVSHQLELKNFFTVKSAYEYIINNRPLGLDEGALKSCNINFYLSENLAYDKLLSDRNRTGLLKQVSLTSGMIQAGERIVDRGEIVTQRTSSLLNSLKIELDKQKGTATQYNLMWMGQIILIAGLMMLLFLYLYLFRINIYENIKHTVFLLLMVLLIVSFASLAVKFNIFDVYIVPFALLPIIVRIFFDSRTALFTHIITTLQIALIVPDSFEFVLLQLAAGMTAVSSLKDLTQRSQLVRVAIFIFISYAVMYMGNSLLVEGDLTKIEWQKFISFGISSTLLLFAYGLIYIFEKMFGFLSNVTLVELSNVNSPLLQEYAEVAPGSFQHSLQVANLVTDAVKKINGNSLLVRIGAIYHDIGKMNNPMFFTENQLSGVNPLANIDYETAAQHIISHVDDGIKIAHKHNLPEKIIDFIRTHHGASRTRYFYNSFKNNFPDAKVNESAFMYKGPSPTTKEQAALMMADAVEASSRSLSEYSDESINLLVDTIIDKQIADGLFRHAKITFMDVEVVKSVFKEKLKTIYHTRVSYPELKKQ